MFSRYSLSNLREFLDSSSTQKDDTIDVSDSVDTQNQYPNYDVLPHYRTHQERDQPFPVFKLILGTAIGFMAGIAFGGAYGVVKYRRQGYRGSQLIEKVAFPLMKSVFCGSLLGAAVGAKAMTLGPNEDN